MKLSKKMTIFCARLSIEYSFKYQRVFSPRFDQQDEGDQILDETVLSINPNINQKITETDNNNIDIKFSLEYQTQTQGMKYSGWRFKK